MEPIDAGGRPTNMFIRPLIATGTVLLSTVILSGCGDGDGPDGAAPASSPASSSAPATGGNIASLGPTRLTVSVRASRTARPVSHTLTCNPTGGTVAAADEACRQLAAAGGRRALGAATPKGGVCTQQIAGPDVATVTGTIDGRAVSATLRQNDGCHIAQWNRLSTLLGSRAGGD